MKKSKFVSFALFFLGLYLIVSLSRNIFTFIKKGEEIKRQNLKLEELKQENIELKKRLEYVSTPSFIEKEARDKLGLARVGEQVVVLPKNVEEIVFPKEEEKPKELPNWKKWYKFFF